METPHQFVEIDKVSKPDPSVPPMSAFRYIYGLKIMCAQCGEVRDLWPNDGSIEILINGKTSKHDA